MNRGGHDLLAGARLAAHQDRQPRPRDLRQRRELALEPGGERAQQLDAARRPLGLAQRSEGAAHHQEAAAALDDVAIVEPEPFDALLVDVRAVLRAGVLDHPVVTVGAEACVHLGGPAVRQVQPQAGTGAGHGALGTAADLHLVQAGERQPQRRRGDSLAVERDAQHPPWRSLLRTRRLRAKGAGGAHVGIIPLLRPPAASADDFVITRPHRAASLPSPRLARASQGALVRSSFAVSSSKRFHSAARPRRAKPSLSRSSSERPSCTCRHRLGQRRATRKSRKRGRWPAAPTMFGYQSVPVSWRETSSSPARRGLPRRASVHT